MANKRKYTGLTAEQVLASRQRYGSNVFTPAKRDPLWKKFALKFKDPLIIILLIAGFLSIGISFYEYLVLGEGKNVFFEPVGIFIAILLATGIAFIFETRAENEFNILNKINDDTLVQVLRDDNITKVPKRDIVVDDIVILSTGDEVPADGTLLEATSLRVDESSLTGELSCSKTTDEAQFDENATFPSNVVLRGTNVMEGHGVMRVTAVGDLTENGKVMEAAQISDNIKTPLNEQLDRLGMMIARISYLIAALIVVGRIVAFAVYNPGVSLISLQFGAYMLQTVMLAVTLIVVAVPEGLPMAVTMSLAYSMRQMLKSNNLVRNLHACETMGAATVICTDKTGTLTMNQMRVAQTFFPALPGNGITASSPEAELLKEAIAVNSTAEIDLSHPEKPAVIGNPTEGALLLWLREADANYLDYRAQCEVLEELPFSTENKFMATAVKSAAMPGKKVVHLKGAPEIIMRYCTAISGNATPQQVQDVCHNYQLKGMRTLGFAYKVLGDGETAVANGQLAASGLTFMGVAGISDPVRPDVPAAVQECLTAGIDVKVVTGDSPRTAAEIGRQIGIINDVNDAQAIITGPEIAAMSDDELRSRATSLKVISRARPLDKKRLVEALQHNGEVVAVTGDGTNDAPALKAAHVGLSMGDGTAVAKEASDITILDNSFGSITQAVMWGRSLYKNIQRFILFQMTVNVVACLIVLAGAFMGTQSPLTVTQMLWVNLIMDSFAAMALASLPPSKSVMLDKPRNRKDFIISPAMKRSILGVGLIFTAILGYMLYCMEHSVTTTNSLAEFLRLPTANHSTFDVYEDTLFFTFFVMLQFWNLFNARAFGTGGSALQFKNCRLFWFIVAVIFVGQIFIVELGGEMFNVCPLSLTDWVTITLVTSLVLWIGELSRLVRNHGSNASHGQA